MKTVSVKSEQIEIFMQVDEAGNPGYLRFAQIDEHTKKEVAYLGSIDRNHKHKLRRLKKVIDAMLKMPAKGKKVRK